MFTLSRVWPSCSSKHSKDQHDGQYQNTESLRLLIESTSHVCLCMCVFVLKSERARAFSAFENRLKIIFHIIMFNLTTLYEYQNIMRYPEESAVHTHIGGSRMHTTHVSHNRQRMCIPLDCSFTQKYASTNKYHVLYITYMCRCRMSIAYYVIYTNILSKIQFVSFNWIKNTPNTRK